MRYLLPILLLAHSSTFAEDTSPRIAGSVVTLDPADPSACRTYVEFLGENRIVIKDEKSRRELDRAICGPESGRHMVSLVVLERPEEVAGPKDPSPLKITISGQAGGSMEKETNVRVAGSVKLDKKWLDDHELNMVMSGEYIYDADGHRASALLSAQHTYYMTDHWALFALASLKHDGGKDIDFGTDEVAGLLYNLFPFADPTSLKFSVGLGHLFEYLADGSYHNDLTASYRVKFTRSIEKHLELMAAIWFKHAIYSAHSVNGDAWADLADPANLDFRILLDLNLKVKDAFKLAGRGVSINLTFQDEYFNVPPTDDARRNNIRGLVGFEVVF